VAELSFLASFWRLSFAAKTRNKNKKKKKKKKKKDKSSTR
jgi:hypothetical protein